MQTAGASYLTILKGKRMGPARNPHQAARRWLLQFL